MASGGNLAKDSARLASFLQFPTIIPRLAKQHLFLSSNVGMEAVYASTSPGEEDEHFLHHDYIGTESTYLVPHFNI